MSKSYSKGVKSRLNSDPLSNTTLHGCGYLHSHVLLNSWLCRYRNTRKVVFDNGSEFKRDFTPLLKDFNIKPVLMSVNNPQAHVDLIGPYSKSIRQHNLGVSIMQKDDSLTCMTMIDPATG